jgi:multiple sugar transport system permease protein
MSNVAIWPEAQSPNNNRIDRVWSVVAHILLILGAIVMVGPFVWMIHSSTLPTAEAYRYPPVIFPSYRAWENYERALTLVPFGRFYFNSAVVATTITLAQLFTCSLGAFAFARMRFPGREVLFLAYLATMMVPFEVTLIPSFIIIRELDWIDSYPALIAPFIFSAYGTFLLRQFFKSVHRDLYDAARVDGAGYFEIYWRIFLPLAAPALAALGVFVFLHFWNSFFWPLVVTNSMEMRTVPIGIALFQGRDSIQWNLMMAATTLAVIPTLLVFLVAQRYFVRGIMLSGIKG